MKIKMYTSWKMAPTELTVATKMIPGETRGKPYQRHIKQFKRAYTYGNPENCSVDWPLIIRLNVGLRRDRSNLLTN